MSQIEKACNVFIDNPYFNWVGDDLAPRCGICKTTIMDTINEANRMLAGRSPLPVRRCKANVIMGGIALVGLVGLQKVLDARLVRALGVGFFLLNVLPGGVVWAKSAYESI